MVECQGDGGRITNDEHKVKSINGTKDNNENENENV